MDRHLEEEAVDKLIESFLKELTERDRKFFEEHMMPRPSRRETAQKFGMSEDQVRYLEKKLRERAVEFLKRVGYLEVAGSEVRRAAAMALFLLALLPSFPIGPEPTSDGPHNHGHTGPGSSGSRR